MTSRPVPVITGTTSGIGLRAVGRFADAGYLVLAVARDPERGRRTVERLRGAGLDRLVEHRTADLSSRRSVEALTEAILAEHGRVAVLANNAAVFDLTQRTPVLTTDGIERVLATNHLGPLLLTAGLIPALSIARGTVLTVTRKGLRAHPWMTLDPESLGGTAGFRLARAYYRSKLAQLASHRAWADRCPDVRFLAIEVPAVRLDADRLAALPSPLRRVYALKGRSALHPDELAGAYLRTVESVDLPTGAYVDHRGWAVRPPRAVRDPERTTLLDERSLTLVGLAGG